MSGREIKQIHKAGYDPKCKVTPNPSDINQSHLINYFQINEQ